MSMIRVENLTFAYPSSYDNIFENVNFQIDTDWKLGFVGRNGRGKTTFLNLLLGKYEYHGKIQASVQFDYFPYPVNNKNRLTTDILSEVCPLAEEWELLRELSYLEVRDDVLWRPFFTLSNGEQTKVLLAALFLNDGHFFASHAQSSSASKAPNLPNPSAENKIFSDVSYATITSGQ